MSKGEGRAGVRGGAPAEDVARLYDACGPSLYRYALMILADRGDAEDVIQQVFAAVLADRGSQFVQPQAYLRRAVRNAAFSLLRRRRTVRDSQERRMLVDASSAATPEERIALERGLDAVPPEQREVIHLHVYEGLTFKEVAEMTGESINTVAARYRYALARLREMLG